MARLINWLNSHSVDGRPVVTGVRWQDGARRLVVRSLWSGPNGTHGETLETIPATMQAARDWQGY